MALKGKPVAIGNTATTIYTCPATKEAAVHGLLFGNNTASALAVDVIVYNQATGTDVTVVTDLAVPANGVATWSKPINLNAGDAVKAISSAASGMVCLYSTYEDGATPVASGFTARGVWSSGSTYAANDIVSVTGSGTYVAIQASTNQDPTTATAYWMYLEGISASALPVQAGNAGKYLTTDGTDASWGTVDVAGGARVLTSQSASVTLTAADKRTQSIDFTSSGYSVTLPAASTLTLGDSFTIWNKGKDAFGVFNNSSEVLTSVNPDYGVHFSLTDNSTTEGNWEIASLQNQPEFAVFVKSEFNPTNNEYTTNLTASRAAENKFIWMWVDQSSNTIYAKAGKYDTATNTISYGSEISWTVDTLDTSAAGIWATQQIQMHYLEEDKVLAFYPHKAYHAGGFTAQIGGRVLTLSDLTITANTATVEALSYSNNTSSTNGLYAVYNSKQNPSDPNHGIMVAGYEPNLEKILPWTVSGTTVNFGRGAYDISGNSAYGTDIWWSSSSTNSGTVWLASFNTDEYPRYWRSFSINGTSITAINANAYDLGGFFSGKRVNYNMGTFEMSTPDGWGVSVGLQGYQIYFLDPSLSNTSTNIVSATRTSLLNQVTGDTSMIVESETSTELKLLQVGTVAAGLAGTGAGLRRIVFDKTNQSVIFQSYTLIEGDTIHAPGRSWDYVLRNKELIHPMGNDRYFVWGVSSDGKALSYIIGKSAK